MGSHPIIVRRVWATLYEGAWLVELSFLPTRRFEFSDDPVSRPADLMTCMQALHAAKLNQESKVGRYIVNLDTGAVHWQGPHSPAKNMRLRREWEQRNGQGDLFSDS